MTLVLCALARDPAIFCVFVVRREFCRNYRLIRDAGGVLLFHSILAGLLVAEYLSCHDDANTTNFYKVSDVFSLNAKTMEKVFLIDDETRPKRMHISIHGIVLEKLPYRECATIEEAVSKIVLQLKGKKNIRILGSSLGGTIALRVSQEIPVKTVVSVCGANPLTPALRDLARVLCGPSIFSLWYARVVTFFYNAFGAVDLRHLSDEQLIRHSERWYDSLTHNVLQKKSMAKKIFFIEGREDLLVQHSYLKRKVQFFPQSQMIFVHGGHSPRRILRRKQEMIRTLLQS